MALSRVKFAGIDSDIFTSGVADSAQVQSQFDSAFPSAFDTRFALQDTHDSAATQAQIDSAAIWSESGVDISYSLGNVGIGVESPAQRLDVREEKTGGGVLVQVYNEDNSDTTTQAAGIALGPDTRGGTARITAVKENADFSTNAGRDVALTFSSVLNNSPTERARITSAGNFGIGTDAPTEALHLSGSSAQLIKIENTDTSMTGDQVVGGIQFRVNDPSGSGVGDAGQIVMRSGSSVGGQYYIQFNTANASTKNVEMMRVHPSGGITFNGDFADGNRLDDYEEGTWDPRPSTSNSSLSLFSGLTISSYAGTYQKVGGWVHVQYYFQWSNTSSSTSQVYMILPFTAANSYWSGTATESSFVTFPTGTSYITVRPESNASWASFKGCGSGINRVDMTGNNFFASSGGYVLGTFTYPVA